MITSNFYQLRINSSTVKTCIRQDVKSSCITLWKYVFRWLHAYCKILIFFGMKFIYRTLVVIFFRNVFELTGILFDKYLLVAEVCFFKFFFLCLNFPTIFEWLFGVKNKAINSFLESSLSNYPHYFKNW